MPPPAAPPVPQVVIDAGAVPIFVQLLHSPIDDVREQAVWALGNIAGDSPRCRDLVLQHGALAPLMEQLKASWVHGGAGCMCTCVGCTAALCAVNCWRTDQGVLCTQCGCWPRWR